MFTTNHFELTPKQLGDVINDLGDERSAAVAITDALQSAFNKISILALQEEGGRVDLLRGAALILFDILHIIETQVSAEGARRRNPSPTTDRRYEV